MTASPLIVKARGREAVIGFVDGDIWAPLIRLAGASAAFNVMDLWVRQKDRWALTEVRGTPTMVAEALAGPLRFTWAFEVHGSLSPPE
ncbi:MAG: hypothetical protein Q8P41_07290 [Pseudomonadota bacterium]|nr:hypothetical protein [Pseudomonadota bacterium]